MERLVGGQPAGPPPSTVRDGNGSRGVVLRRSRTCERSSETELARSSMKPVKCLIRGAAGKISAVAMCFAVVTTRVCAANVTFSPGAVIIDMGQPSQNPANALKPYGLIYRLVVSNQVVVNWAINPSKITDKNPAVTVEGIDFVLNGKPYRGGPFIIPAEFVDPVVTNLIATWRAKGV